MATFWITRDADDNGNLSPECVIWLDPPRLIAWPDTHGTTWIYPLARVHDDPIWGKCAVDTIFRWCHTYPETGRECIRVERPGEHSDYPRPAHAVK